MTKKAVKPAQVLPNCAKCSKRVCTTEQWQQGPDNCPTKIRADVIKRATDKCFSSEFHEFAYQASRQEGSGFMRLPHTPEHPSPVKSRVEETMEFAHRMGFKKIGVAFCGGVMYEAGILVPILENRGFEVVSACCKCGSIPKEDLGLKDEEKVWIGKFEPMCHPIAQAEILNEANTDFNIMLCLCVGHDSLFLKHSKAFCTVLAAKDRLFGHNPLAGLYLSTSYHRRVLAKKVSPDATKEAEITARKQGQKLS